MSTLGDQRPRRIDGAVPAVSVQIGVFLGPRKKPNCLGLLGGHAGARR